VPSASRRDTAAQAKTARNGPARLFVGRARGREANRGSDLRQTLAAYGLATCRHDDRCPHGLRRAPGSDLAVGNRHSRRRCERGRHPARRRTLSSFAGDRCPYGSGVSRVGLEASARTVPPSGHACSTHGGLRLQGPVKRESRPRPPWGSERVLSRPVEPLHRRAPSGGSARPLRSPWRLGRLRRDARSQTPLVPRAALPRPYRSEGINLATQSPDRPSLKEIHGSG
jgi:hypothetical protein